MRFAIVLVALGLAATASAQVDPRIDVAQADASPTAFSCSVDTLLADRPCYFESLAARSARPREQGRENVRRAAALAADACDRAARPPGLPRPEAAVLDACKKEMAQAVEMCAEEGEYALLDAEDRFSAAAKPCYRAMVLALSKVRLMAATTARCCRCLAQTPCGKGEGQCNKRLARGEVAFAGKCLAPCSDECRSFIPDRGPAPGEARRFTPTAVPRPLDPDCAHVNTGGVNACGPDGESKRVLDPPVQVIVR